MKIKFFPVATLFAICKYYNFFDEYSNFLEIDLESKNLTIKRHAVSTSPLCFWQ